jgi:hypothetical protein
MVEKIIVCDCGLPDIQEDKTCGKCGHSIPEARIAKLTAKPSEPAQKFDVRIENRDAAENRKIAEMLINQLANTKKYNRAIRSGDFAAFSIIGTDDWEDYASLSLQALTLLTLTNIDKNLEEIKNSIKKND